MPARVGISLDIVMALPFSLPASAGVPPLQHFIQVTTSSTTSNPGALANSLAAILASALAFAPAEAAPGVDGMTWNAAEVKFQNRFVLPSAILFAAVGINA
jgi:hypothetical protein